MAPLPIVALLILVERLEVAILLVPAIPIGVIDDDFMIVPTMVVVMILVVITDRARAANARRGQPAQRPRVSTTWRGSYVYAYSEPPPYS